MAEAQRSLQTLIKTDHSRASAIDTRHRVLDNHSAALECLSIVGQIGHPDFEETAFAALAELTALEEQMPTDIDRALERLEQESSVRRYQAMWREQNGVPQPSVRDQEPPKLSREETEAMDDWVETRLTSEPAIRIRLPPKRKPLVRPSAVAISKKEGTGHPAALVTAPRTGYRARRSNVGVSSHLEGLFSREGEVDAPEFLRQPEGHANSRLRVAARHQEHKKKLMGTAKTPKKVSQTQMDAPAPKKSGAKPLYAYIPGRETRSVVLQGNPGEKLSVRVDSETLACVDSRNSELVACRGMRLTRVSWDEDDREVHTRKELDRALAAAASAGAVTLTFEPSSRKHLIEKRKRDWQEKVSGKLPGK